MMGCMREDGSQMINMGQWGEGSGLTRESYIKMYECSQEVEKAPEGIDLKRCRAHRLASSYGMPLNYSSKCSCCSHYLSKEPLTATFSLVKIYYCGPQLASYLTILKNLVLFLLSLSLFYALPLSIINFQGHGCSSLPGCSSSILLALSVFNCFDNPRNIDLLCYMLAIAFLVSLIILQFLRRAVAKVKYEIEESNLYPTGFAVFCQLPFNHISEQKAMKEVDRWWKRQKNGDRDKMLHLFPELFGQQQSSKDFCHSREISEISKKGIQVQSGGYKSELVQQIICSYNYAQFKARKQELQFFHQDFSDIKTFTKDKQLGKMVSLYGSKKKILDQISRNQFCVMMFKNKGYADYFWRKNNSSLLGKMFCFQKFRNLQIEKRDVRVMRDIFPTEIYWQNHHLSGLQRCRNHILSWIVLCLCMLIGSAAIFGIIYLIKTEIFANSSWFTDYCYIFAGIGTNILLILFNKLITILTKKEKHLTYFSQQISLIYKIVILNCFVILFAPIILFQSLENELIFADNGYIQIVTATSVTYMVLAHIGKYLSVEFIQSIYSYVNFNPDRVFNQNQANQKYSKPRHFIEQEYASVLTVVYITFFLLPFSPYLTVFSTIWMFFQFWFERINIAYFIRQDDFHGSILSNRIVQLLQKSMFLFILGTCSSCFLAYQHTNYRFSIHIIVIISIIFFLSLVYAGLPLESINKRLFSRKFHEEDKNTEKALMEISYQKAKQTFLKSYEEYNEPYRYCNEEKKAQAEKETNAINDEMNTMSKTLTVSIKQRLNEQNFLDIKRQKLKLAKQQMKDMYFQYQKKIHMKKVLPKVKIPPLFSKLAVKNPPPVMEEHIANFGDAFSDEQSEVKQVKVTKNQNL